MSVRTNTAALSTLSNIASARKQMGDAIASVSSGKRITKVSVDAAGFAVSVRLTADINVLNQAIRNTSAGSSVTSVALGAQTQVSDILQRLKTLSASVVSGALSDTERGYADAEYQKLLAQINNTASQTVFNGIKLVSGGASTVTNTTANVASSVLNAGAPGNFFENVISPGRSRGFIEGQVTDASVKEVVAGSNDSYQISIQVGSQTFTSLFSAPNTNQSQSFVNLVSTSNDQNIISLPWNGNAAGHSAAILDGDIKTIFGTQNGQNASIVMAHNTSASITSVTAPTGGVSGVWAIQSSGDGTTGKFSATDGITTFTASTTTNGAQTLTFGNGLTLNLATGYTTATGNAISQFRVQITSGNEQTLSFQVGQQAIDKIDLQLFSVSTTALGLTGTTVASVAGATAASSAIDAAITTLNTNMAETGAVQSQFEFSAATTASIVENLVAARGVIEDANIGDEMTKFTIAQILFQMGQAMLAQANQSAQIELRALGG